nr:hypothetical protein [Mangrovicoccus ximenensis]
MLEDLAHRSLLDDLAEIHHRHVIGDMAHHLQVVADEEIGQVQLALDFPQQLQHLAAHRDVERSGRLVEQHHLGIDRDRPGDADALALAAAELVRITAEMFVAEPDQPQQFRDARRPVGGGQRQVQPERLVEHLADRHARVQRGIRVLEHHLQAAVHARELPRVEPPDIVAVQHDLALRRLDQPHQAARHGRFARTAFADQGQGAPRMQVEIDSVDGVELLAAPDRKQLAQAAHPQDRVIGGIGLHPASSVRTLAASSLRV